MRILYVSKSMTVPVYRQKLEALGRRVELLTVVPARWGAQATPTAGAAPVRLVPTVLHGHNHFHLYRGLPAILQEFKPDLVHIDEEAYSAVTWQVARLAARQGTRSLFFAAQTLDKRIPPPFAQTRSYVFARVNGGIAGTEKAGSVLRSSGYRGPLAVIPQLGVDPAFFRADAQKRASIRQGIGWTEDDFVIVFAGRLVAQKGVHLCLEALKTLPAVKFLVVGDGPERARLERMAALLPPGSVHFTGMVESTAMPAWLAASDALVLPSLTMPNIAEQFGRVLVEAMSCELAVIGSASGEIPVVIGDAGVVVPEDDAGALRAAFARLAQDREARRRLAAAGRTRVCAHFTHECISEQTVNFYEQLLAART